MFERRAGMFGQLHRGFDCFRAAVAEEKTIQTGWNNRQQFIDQPQHGLVINDICLPMN